MRTVDLGPAGGKRIGGVAAARERGTMAGYSGTPLVKKLGIKEGFRICALDPPDGYDELLGPLPDGVTPRRLEEGELDFVHLFALTESRLRELLEPARAAIAQNGMVWISWPKKSSGVESELDGNVVRGIGLAASLVDVKVCAVDETWSGLKFVIRRVDRA